MTSLDDLPSGYTAPLPVDEHEADAGGSVGEGDYEQSAVAALLGMAACQAVFPLSRVSSYGSAKSELSGGRRLADSRENSSDDLSTDSGDVKRQRVERSDLGGAWPVRPAPACTLTRLPHIPHPFLRSGSSLHILTTLNAPATLLDTLSAGRAADGAAGTSTALLPPPRSACCRPALALLPTHPRPAVAPAAVVLRAGGPPPGTCRFQCKYPNCMKMYSSTDAVRKHCRKRHLEWLRKLDQVRARRRGRAVVLLVPVALRARIYPLRSLPRARDGSQPPRRTWQPHRAKRNSLGPIPEARTPLVAGRWPPTIGTYRSRRCTADGAMMRRSHEPWLHGIRAGWPSTAAQMAGVGMGAWSNMESFCRVEPAGLALSCSRTPLLSMFLKAVT